MRIRLEIGRRVFGTGLSLNQTETSLALFIVKFSRETQE